MAINNINLNGSEYQIQDEKEHLNRLATPVEIIGYTDTPYTFTEDGYLIIDSSTHSGNIITGNLMGDTGSQYTMQISSVANTIRVFVKKGMKFQIVSTTGTDLRARFVAFF